VYEVAQTRGQSYDPNFTKAGPASTASPPLRGETDEKRPIFYTKTKENIHCYIRYFTAFFFRLRGENTEEGGWKKPEQTEQSNKPFCSFKSSEN